MFEGEYLNGKRIIEGNTGLDEFNERYYDHYYDHGPLNLKENIFMEKNGTEKNMFIKKIKIIS